MRRRPSLVTNGQWLAYRLRLSASGLRYLAAYSGSRPRTCACMKCAAVRFDVTAVRPRRHARALVCPAATSRRG